MKRSIGPQTLAYPLPVFLVGSYDKNGKANIMTAAWGGICCSEPPSLAVSIRPARWTCESVLQRKAFTISIPTCSIAAQADYAGIASGRNADKFAASGLTPVRSDLVDAPYVAQCPVVLELSLFKTLELGSHIQFVGRIVDVKVDEDCFAPDGKPDIQKINPLLYDAGAKQYCRVGESAGKGFSIGKPILKI